MTYCWLESVDTMRSIIDTMSARYKVGTIVYSPGSFLFNVLRITQNDDHSIAVEADEKMSCINPVPITRVGRKQFEEPVNTVYRSCTGSVGWIGVAASPFCGAILTIFCTTSFNISKQAGQSARV